jgi:hypothetical protein
VLFSNTTTSSNRANASNLHAPTALGLAKFITAYISSVLLLYPANIESFGAFE